MSDTLLLDIAPGWRKLFVRWGRWRALLAVTVFSIVASMGLTALLIVALGLGAYLGVALLIGGLVPAIVAPLAAHFVVTMAFEMEQARSELHRLATRDSLTQTFNRRYMVEQLEAETARAARSGQPLSVLMIDADQFKAINDRFGHATGDRVLQHIADACTASLRPYDLLARYGGEEFVVLLPETTLPQAGEVAERVLAAVSQAKLDGVVGEPLEVTVSIGAAVLASTDTSGAALLQRADAALYQAKRNGRNGWAC